MTRGMWRNFDWILFGALLLVALIGIVFIWSANLAATGSPFSDCHVKLWKPLFFLGLSVTVFFAVLLFDYRLYRHLAYVAYGAMIVLLAGLFFVPAIARTHRWYAIPGVPFRFQPSEFMKIAMVLALGRFLMFRRSIKRVAGLVLPGVIVLVPMGLIFRQPDLGTALLLPAAAVAMLFVVGARLRHILPVAVIAVASIGAVFFVCLRYDAEEIADTFEPLEVYQVKRIQAFLDPDAHPEESYQYRQSLLAIGSGRLFGKGWGQGTQNRLNFLPESHTDFIFAVVGEERGFLGLMVLFGLMTIIVVRTLGIAARTREPFARLIVVGIITMFATQTAINAGMTVGLVPITGMTLPLVSYGGSSLLATFVAFGLVMNVSMRRITVLAGEDFD